MVDWLVLADAGRTVIWGLMGVELVRGQKQLSLWHTVGRRLLHFYHGRMLILINSQHRIQFQLPFLIRILFKLQIRPLRQFVFMFGLFE